MDHKKIRFPLLHQIRYTLFPPVPRKKALEKIQKQTGTARQDITLLNPLPHNVHLYNSPTEPCWYAFIPWNDGIEPGTCLRSSRLICLSKRTGQILYDGSANDEG